MFRTNGGVTRTSQRTHMRTVDVRTRENMDIVHTQILGVLSMITGLAFAMVWLAARMSMIELRRPAKCPACGRLRHGRSCGCGA
jgi:hypothetical protein